jgi:uncharacterized membrane protein YkoI
MMITVFRLTVLMLLCSVVPAAAEEPEVSPRLARAALAQGLIRPLAELLAIVDAHYIGSVLEAELHQEKGHWRYEFEMLPPDGRLYRVYVDATTGAVTSTTGPVQERR